MLRTDARLLLSEALLPPDGYRTETLVGTTYSMHLSALLAVPLSLTFADWEGDDGAPTPNPVAALEAVRRHAERITVFAQAGATAATEQPPLVASWLEDVVVPAKAPFGGVFHPKVWVAKFVSDVDPPRFRVVCGSRNLTFDRSWDSVIVLDGQRTPRGGRSDQTRPLADFLAGLPELAVGSVSATRRDAIESLAGDLERVRFEPPDGFDDLSFWPLGVARHRADPITAARRARFLVVSPFVSESWLRPLTCERDDNVLVSRGEELAHLALDRLPQFDAVCTLDDEPDALLTATEDNGVLSGLHAKVYVADAGYHASLWTGSANATTAAFSTNVEFLVQLDGLRSSCGVDAVLGGEQEDNTLRSMLIAAPPSDGPVEPDAIRQLERDLDALTHDLAERTITARVTSPDNGITYTVELVVDTAIDLADGLAVTCWPLTGRADRDAAAVPASATHLARFAHQPIAAITAFYVFALTLSRDGHEANKQMIVRADLEGAPDGRREAILRELLQDPEQVLRLLRVLLALDAGEGNGDGLGFLSELTGSSSGHAPAETPLLESMLRALDEAPEKLVEVAGLIDELRSVEDVLPAGLLEIWEPIYAAYQESR